MEYIHRELEKKFMRMDSFFKAVLVVGARQVGKSTMLKRLAREQERTVVTMDDDFVRELAQNDPVLFFQTYKPPILIDEIQKAPQLTKRKAYGEVSGNTCGQARNTQTLFALPERKGRLYFSPGA